MIYIIIINTACTEQYRVLRQETNGQTSCPEIRFQTAKNKNTDQCFFSNSN
jgi:hypothetical protein